MAAELGESLRDLIRQAVLEALAEHERLRTQAAPPPAAASAPEWLSIPAVAKAYRVSRAHLAKLVEEGRLPSTSRTARGGRTMLLFRKSDLDLVLAPAAVRASA